MNHNPLIEGLREMIEEMDHAQDLLGAGPLSQHISEKRVILLAAIKRIKDGKTIIETKLRRIQELAAKIEELERDNVRLTKMFGSEVTWRPENVE